MCNENSASFRNIHDSLRCAYALDGVPIEAFWILDQLLGAVFSLRLGQSIGAPDQADPELYRKDPFAIYDLRSPAYRHFAWGFYLNSAVDRVVFAHERLDGLTKHLGRSEKRAHGVLPDRDTSQTHKKATNYYDTVTEENVLYILGQRVIRQKHHIPQRARHQTSGIELDDAAWEDLAPTVQHCFVKHAIEKVLEQFIRTFLPASV